VAEQSIDEQPADVAEPAPQPPPDRLIALAADVGQPDAAVADVAREALDSAARAGVDRMWADRTGADGFGRLADLACWWASVHGGGEGPRAVVLVGATVEVATRRPGTRRTPLGAGRSVDEAVEAGVRIADEAAGRGADLVVLSLDAPAAARAVTAAQLGLDPVEASGWPAARGLDDADWMDEVADLRDRLRPLRAARDRPADLLRALGHRATASAAALLVQCAVRGTPVLLDGPGAAAAALVARSAGYTTSGWWQAAHLSPDPIHERALDALGLEPLARLGITVEDGTAGLVGLAVLEQATALGGTAR